MEELKPMRFEKDTVIFDVGQRPTEVCFVMSGTILNVTNGRLYSLGNMFGEDDIIFKRERRDTIIADVDCYLLTYSRKVFQKILSEYPEIKIEVTE